MSKIKLVSGKEVNANSLIFWILKSDLTINSCRLKDLDINTSYKEDKECSEIFATKQEAKEWLEKYKNDELRYKAQGPPSRNTCEVNNKCLSTEKEIPKELKITPQIYGDKNNLNKKLVKVESLVEGMNLNHLNFDPDNSENKIPILNNNIKPNYYKSKSGQDVLDIIEDFNLDFYMGSCLKYIVRAGKKDKETTISDISKAIEYLQRKIKSLEK